MVQSIAALLCLSMSSVCVCVWELLRVLLIFTVQLLVCLCLLARQISALTPVTKVKTSSSCRIRSCLHHHRLGLDQ